MDKARASSSEEEAGERGLGGFRNGVQCSVWLNCEGGAGAGRGIIEESERLV